MAQNIQIREESEEELLRRLPAGTVIQPPFRLQELQEWRDAFRAEIDDAEWELFGEAIHEARRADCQPRDLLRD
ncbi:hypothetical protein F183_A34850 [Bryobacterales bacterium F-183]|nr:hypothetical protein F183_A34850 [Bryobacterales bacterium F-183]